jgi:hypothetical protein
MLPDAGRSVTREPWREVSAAGIAAASSGIIILLYFLKSAEDGFVGLDYVNLVFHEAGHLIFGVFGPTWGLYGGTVGQLVFPITVIVLFCRKREPIAVTVGLIWVFENLLNIARYMADARMQVLPLVGGGEHDWTDIFSRWGVLASDTTIATVVSTIGWLGMLTAWGWLLWRWRVGIRPHLD